MVSLAIPLEPISTSTDTLLDCVRFQELLLSSKLVFIAGIAEAKSKGRGEECISQNLRLLRGRHERLTLLFFANSQRKERKRYVSVPLNCIDKIDVPKKTSKPVLLYLRPNFEILAEMKVLQFHFLDDDGKFDFETIYRVSRPENQIANFFFFYRLYRAKEIWRNHRTPHRAVDSLISPFSYCYLIPCMAFQG